MKSIIKYLILLFSLNVCCQELPNFSAVDSLYREDQFYAGITYNVIQNKNLGISQGKFTPSFSFGFLRDMPVNKKRTFAIAIGLGYSINNFNQNILINENNGNFTYSIANSQFDKNKQILHYIDLPIELRWRNSTPESHKFYRIYLGLKASYLVYDRLNFESIAYDKSIISNNDFNNFQYGTYISIGNNTINLYAYYGLSSIYKSAFLNNEPLKLKTLNFGFMFYIL
jgi:Outer membrane protein beta-barrel domain